MVGFCAVGLGGHDGEWERMAMMERVSMKRTVENGRGEVEERVGRGGRERENEVGKRKLKSREE